MSSECFPSVQHLLPSVQHLLRAIKRAPLHQKGFSPSKGLRSIKRASLHQKGSAPSKGLLSVLRAIKLAALHPIGFPPFPLLSEWLPLLQKGSAPFLWPFKGCAPFPLLSEWLPLLCHWLRSVLRALQLASLRQKGFPPLPLASLRS